MSDNNVIIHIGLIKTGSTYLQNYIFPHLSKTIFINGHEDFTSQWQDQVLKNNEHILISDENFSGKAWKKENYYSRAIPINSCPSVVFERNVKFLKQCFPKAKIFIFFRRHGDLVISMYRQYIKNRGTLLLDDFYGKEKIIHPSWLSYQKKIQILQKYFDDGTYFIDYTDFQKYGDQFIIDFFQQEFDIQFNGKIDTPKRTNVGMKGRGLIWCRKMNKLYNKISLPEIVQKSLRLMKLDPAGLIQNRMPFINNQDPKEFQEIKEEINEYFRNDWLYFQKNKYTYPITT